MSSAMQVTAYPHRGTDARYPVREAPAPRPTSTPPVDEAHPAVPNEPILNLEDIQGNIIPGFNKPTQALLFVRFADPLSARAWLGELVPLIATAEEVVGFAGLFKSMRDRRGYNALRASWLNIAFAHRGLRMLTPDADAFTDPAFRAGMAARSEGLGDPVSGEGSPATWRVGGPGTEADAVVIVAADLPSDLEAEIARVMQMMSDSGGVALVAMERGAVLGGEMTGHEHFGFLDGVSQPGLRGRRSANPRDVLTVRQTPGRRNEQGKPGQDLLWPGEFVFGYPGQDAEAEDISVAGPDSDAGPDWADDGAYLVFRRLRQDVHGFHSFLRSEAARLDVDPEMLGAKLVGRWRSGAPVERAAAADIPALGGDEGANNNFEFEDDADPIHMSQVTTDADAVDETFPRARADADGAVCPLGAHIRKAYPRDDRSRSIPVDPPIGEVSTQTHRLLRRGIPFGPQSPSTIAAPVADGADRGLLFLAYQTSIVDQFEFVTKVWVNNPDFKEVGRGGVDIVIGQNHAGDGVRRCPVSLPGPGGPVHAEVVANRHWVLPSGGEYMFAPSISALEMLASG